MFRLKAPTFSYDETIERCAEGIKNKANLRNKLLSGKQELLNSGMLYEQKAKSGLIHEVVRCNERDDDIQDPLVVADLSKSELLTIYKEYLVAKKPGREVYDSLLHAADDACPYCGGIGAPRNLDHFLPKTEFPLYSILPQNLVPACRDCNMDNKKAIYANSSQTQLIQPYLDKDQFFDKQWIFANYTQPIDHEPGLIEYYVKPPSEWCEEDQMKVCNHFKIFNLRGRYGVKAGGRLRYAADQIKNLQKKGLTNNEIKTCILEPVITKAQFINHWEPVMYHALISNLT